MKLAAAILLLAIVTAAPVSSVHADPDDYYDDDAADYRAARDWDDMRRSQQENHDRLMESVDRSSREFEESVQRKREEEEREREFEERLREEREEADRQARARYYEPPECHNFLETTREYRSKPDPLDRSPFDTGRTPSVGQGVLRQLETID